uniref:Ovule protein n=1 Tax=Heterorhabditis bacteriophora TaxID=37862 RepID=A0A1I7WZ83_HETBA
MGHSSSRLIPSQDSTNATLRESKLLQDVLLNLFSKIDYIAKSIGFSLMPKYLCPKNLEPLPTELNSCFGSMSGCPNVRGAVLSNNAEEFPCFS